MAEEASIIQLSNGLTLISEEVPEADSVAYELSIPGGMLCDSKGEEGTSLLLAEILSRGAGPYDSKKLSDEFDKFGIRHVENALHDRFSFKGLCLAGDEIRGLELLSMMMLEAWLPGEYLESIKQLLLFDLDALADAPSERTLIALAERYFPDPHGRSPYGSRDGIKSASRERLEERFKEQFKPQGSVLSICGGHNRDKILDFVEKVFANWVGKSKEVPRCLKVNSGFYEHKGEKTSQLYLALAFPAVPCTHPLYYVVRVLNEILSGGMYGRLFLEIRERRGLCYSVHSRYSGTEDLGTFFVHASTTPEKADVLLRVLSEELQKSASDIDDEELARAKINLQTSLILGEEGVSSRCAGNLYDWWFFKRIRSIKEIREKIQAVRKQDIAEYLQEYPFLPLSLVTLGRRRIAGVKV